MNKYQTFVFDNYDFSPETKTLTLRYKIDDTLYFSETYKFDFDYISYAAEDLDKALQGLFFMAGVSYYKTYLPPNIVINKGQLTDGQAAFFSRTYQRGLGEFFYVNQLDPQTPIIFPGGGIDLLPTKLTNNSGLLIGIGGGKDSLVTAEQLRDQSKVATWSVNHHTQLTPLVERIGLPHFWVGREWDNQLLDLNKQGALNGHIPISAIFASVGLIISILTGYRDNVVSNESSANEPNLTYQDIPINHQYSKSIAFEKDFQQYLQPLFSDQARYYSFLRPLSEVRIASIFAELGFDKYASIFSSCNRSFTHDSDRLFWCGECPKCAFTFLALTPFVDREKLEHLFGGKNLLLDEKLEPVYKQLLGIEDHKPLDCVGEVKEARQAMRLAQKIYPELNKYVFDLPDSYDYKQLAGHAMPDDIFKIYQTKTILN